MTKLFNKALMLLLCVVQVVYSAEQEIITITRDATIAEIQLTQEGPFVIGNKTFESSDLQTLTEKERKILDLFRN